MDIKVIFDNLVTASEFLASNQTISAGMVALNATILMILAVGIPALGVGILALFKIKIGPRNSMYLYAFTSGLMLLLGTVGLIGEGIEHLHNYFEENQATVGSASDPKNVAIIVGVLIAGVLVGMGAVFLTRHLVVKKERLEMRISEDQATLNQLGNNQLENCIDGVCQHSDAIYNYRDIEKREARLEKSNKSIAVILMLSHRLVDGMSLGVFAPIAGNGIASFANWGIIIVFCLHLVPSSMVIYLTQLDLYKSRSKAYLYSLALLFVFVPFIYIGAFLSWGVGLNGQYTFWIMPFLFTISGTILLLMSVLELIPEFIDNRNMSKKQWTVTILCLSAGIVLSIALLAIHSHPEGGEPSTQSQIIGTCLNRMGI